MARRRPRFVPALHEPGARVLLGRSYAEGGERRPATSSTLVTSPATARHVRKLARHFVARRSAARAGGTLANAFSRRRPGQRVPRRWPADGVAAQIQVAMDWAISTYRAECLRAVANA
jgi:hypothetical protein